MEKKLVKCSYCQEHGTVSVLGEVQIDGSFTVMRFHKGYTIIKAPTMRVLCGNCLSEEYVKTEFVGEVMGSVIQFIHGTG